ncbi:MAG: hypothetical protein Q8K85_17950, partial [Hyphomicrobium sp.]|nr:hypothetical protein [Hyphomicrobium sp.]
TMNRPSFLSLIAAAAAVAACQQEPAADTNVAQEPVLNLPSVAKLQPPMDRASLLAAIAEAASTTAAGTEMPKSVRSLDGRQFEIRIRFGCSGPAADLAERWLGWSFDPEDRRIRVRAMPTISSDEPLVEQVGGDQIEAVEGFWVPRPWLLAPVCPAAAVQRATSEERSQVGEHQQQAQPATRGQSREKPQPAKATEDPAAAGVREPLPAAARIGIAQFFTREDPRSRRRNMRPYQAAYTLPEGQALSPQGYNLVLSGRLRALPGSGVIRCISRSADAPPECVVSAEFLRVWIEKPDTREVIAEWGSG